MRTLRARPRGRRILLLEHPSDPHVSFRVTIDRSNDARGVSLKDMDTKALPRVDMRSARKDDSWFRHRGDSAEGESQGRTYRLSAS